jgi:hypothetical protein
VLARGYDGPHSSEGREPDCMSEPRGVDCMSKPRPAVEYGAARVRAFDASEVARAIDHPTARGDSETL